MTTTTVPPRRVPKPVRILIYTVLIGGSLAGIFFAGRMAQTGPESAEVRARPAYIERTFPNAGAEVLRQSSVGIDLADGYRGYLVINGTEIREEDGLSTTGAGVYRFQPGPGRKIEQLRSDRNTVVAWVWKESDGPNTAERFTWTFRAL